MPKCTSYSQISLGHVKTLFRWSGKNTVFCVLFSWQLWYQHDNYVTKFY